MTQGRRVAGRYRLLHRMGRGGMGVLWAARDERSGLPVALRLLERGVEDADRVAHFRASALAAARLDHPHLARVLDEGHDALGPFIVTEWIDGTPLSDWRGVQAPWGFLRAVVSQLCNALAYVHAHGLVHLDLRPANVLVTRVGDHPSVRLVDVGCARIDDGWSDTGTGPRATLKYLGSLRYMAPEVADSPPWRIGPWSDLYSLGLLLWELLCGDLPFADQQGIALLLRRSSLPPPPLPPERGAPHHGTLANLLARLLARAPTDRPQSAAQVRRTVEALEGEPVWSDPLPRQRPRLEPFDAHAAGAAAFPLWPLQRGPLVGQDAALEGLWRAVQAVVAGYGSRLVVVEGPTAAGKTMLVDTLVEHVVRRGSARVWGATFAPGAPPGTGLLGALEDLLKAGATDATGVADRAEALGLLAGADAEGLDAVLPGLLRPDATPHARPGNEPAPGVEVGSIGSVHMVAGTFLQLLRRAAANDAVVLHLDQVYHATGPEGLDLIERILDDADLSVCVVATARTGEPGTEALRTRFPPDDHVAWVAMSPLGGDALRLYLRARVGLTAADEDRVVRVVDGRPALMRGVTDWLLDGHLVRAEEALALAPGVVLPESMHELLEAQMQALPHTARDALVPDVVLGLAHAQVPLGPRVIEALKADDPHRPYERALLAAERARLMVRRPLGGFVFAHEAIARWLVARAGERARSWHTRWLAVLDRLEGAGRGRLGIERAHHAEAIGAHGRALQALIEAAGWALSPGQPALERGLLAAQRAISLADAVGRPLAGARAHRVQAELLRQAGRLGAARQNLVDAEALLGDDPAPVERGWCHLTLAWLQVDERRLGEAEDAFAAARALFEDAGDEGGVRWTELGLAQVAGLKGQHAVSRTLAREAERGFRALGAVRGTLAAQLVRAHAADRAGDHETALRRYARLLQTADARRWLLEATTLRVHLARLELEMGHPHDALARMDEAACLCDAVRLMRLRELIDAVRPAAFAAAGDPASAHAALHRARLPNPRLCGHAARALRAAVRQPTVALEPTLQDALARWAEQVAAHAERPVDTGRPSPDPLPR